MNIRFKVNRSMREFLKTIIFLVVLLKSNKAEQCCFEEWASWQQDSLSCGQICSRRMRNVINDNDGAAFIALVSGDCNDAHSICPNYESESRSCHRIDCRKFYFEIGQSYFFCSDFCKSLKCIRNYNRNAIGNYY